MLVFLFWVLSRLIRFMIFVVTASSSRTRSLLNQAVSRNPSVLSHSKVSTVIRVTWTATFTRIGSITLIRCLDATADLAQYPSFLIKIK